MALKLAVKSNVRAGIRTTCVNPKFLTWLALKERMHSGRGLLQEELTNYLIDARDHRVAMTYVDGVPACIVLAAEYGQLMVFTRPRFRRLGLAKRTVKQLCKHHNLSLDDYNGAPGVRAGVSCKFFNHMGVNFVD